MNGRSLLVGEAWQLVMFPGSTVAFFIMRGGGGRVNLLQSIYVILELTKSQLIRFLTKAST